MAEEKKLDMSAEGEKDGKTLCAWKGIHTWLLRFIAIFYGGFVLLFLLELLFKLPAKEFLHSHLGVGGTHLLFQGMYLGFLLPFILGIGKLWINSLQKIERHWKLGLLICPIVLCGLFSLIGFLGYAAVSEASWMEDDLDRRSMLIFTVDDNFGNPSPEWRNDSHRGEKVESKGDALERRHSFIVPGRHSDDTPDEVFSNIRDNISLSVKVWNWPSLQFGGTYYHQIKFDDPRIVERRPDLFQAEIPFTTKRSKGTVTVEIRPGTPSDRLAVSIVIREKKGK